MTTKHLSPAAQAVMAAVDTLYATCGQWCGPTDEQVVAAALSALVVALEEDIRVDHDDLNGEWTEIRQVIDTGDIVAIVKEIDPQERLLLLNDLHSPTSPKPPTHTKGPRP